MPFDSASPFASGSIGNEPAVVGGPFPTFGPLLRGVARRSCMFVLRIPYWCSRIPNLFVRAVVRLRSAPVTIAFVAINLGLFLITSAIGGDEAVLEMYRAMAVTHIQVAEGDWWRVFTSVWAHCSWDHVAGNSKWLMLCGYFLEPAIGSSAFLLLYLLTGLGSGLASFLFQTGTSAGASGAIYGLTAAILVCPAFASGSAVVVWLWALQEAVDAIATRESVSLGYACHIGGLLTGLLVGAFFLARGGLPGLASRRIRVPAAVLAAATLVVSMANDPRWTLDWQANRAIYAEVNDHQAEAARKWAGVERDADPYRPVEAAVLCQAAEFRRDVLKDSLGARALLARSAPWVDHSLVYADLATLQAYCAPFDDRAAIENYEAALASDSLSMELRHEMAWLCMFTTDSTVFDPMKALTYARSAMRDTSPPSPEHLRTLAWANLVCGERTEAAQCITRALRSGPETTNLFRAELRAMKESPGVEGQAWTYTAWVKFCDATDASTAAISD